MFSDGSKPESCSYKDNATAVQLHVAEIPGSSGYGFLRSPEEGQPGYFSSRVSSSVDGWFWVGCVQVLRGWPDLLRGDCEFTGAFGDVLLLLSDGVGFLVQTEYLVEETSNAVSDCKYLGIFFF